MLSSMRLVVHLLRLTNQTHRLTAHAGALPRVLPASLEKVFLGDQRANTNTFIGGIPPEWGAITNLKTLKLVACGLDGTMAEWPRSFSCSKCQNYFYQILTAQGNCRSQSYEGRRN